jgi:hypothetical protein
MAIPDFQSMMLPLLRFTADGLEHSMRDARGFLARHFSLGEEEKGRLLPSGKQSVFINRVAWACAHLKMAGLVKATRRACFHITRRGRQVLKKEPPAINMKFLRRFKEYETKRSGGAASRSPSPASARKRKGRVRKSRQLVLGYLERVSSKVFSDYSRQLTDLVRRRHGVYALYKGDRLYYVGLASNLRNRIKQHGYDKHAGKWDKFSLYLVRKADHIKEMESLILRISDPKGNATRGRLSRADDLTSELQSEIRKAQEEQLREIIGVRRSPRKVLRRRKRRLAGRRGRQPALAPYVTKGFRIRAEYKGRTFVAQVWRSGRINFRGTLYNTPSAAGRAAIGHPVDGWLFWCFQKKQGVWVRLDDLRLQQQDTNPP